MTDHSIKLTGSRAHSEDTDTLDQQEVSELVREFRELRRAVEDRVERNQSRSQAASTEQSHRPDRSHHQSPAALEAGVQQSLSELQEAIDDVSTEIAQLESRHDADIARLEADIDDATQSLDELDSRGDNLVTRAELRPLMVSLRNEISAVEETTDALGDRVSDVADAHAELRDELSALGHDHDELAESIKEDLDGIENLFQHLLHRTDRMVERSDTEGQRHDESLAAIEEHIQERNRFAALMREANQKGVSTAVCENCDTEVDLGLLESTRCPECDHAYSGIRTGGWTPLSSATLETEPDHSSPSVL